MYEFPKTIGILIDSPFGSLISEIFLKLFEDEVFGSDSYLLSHIVSWHRYIDDILALRSGSITDFHIFVTFLNSRYPTIEFTFEIGGIRSISYVS